MICIFCGEPAVHRCAWPVEDKIVRVPHYDVELGDRLAFAEENTTGKPHVSVVEEVHRHGETSEFYCINRAGHRVRIIKFYDATVYILRRAGCGNACCDACAREVGEGVMHCIDHWHAWEAVA